MLKLAVIGILALFGQQILAQTFICTKTGLFPDPTTPGCTHYYLCVVSGTQQKVNRRLKCPLDFVFHETLKLCVSPLLYQCPGAPIPIVPLTGISGTGLCHKLGICITTVAPTTTTTVLATTITSPVVGPFVCPGSGDYPDDFSMDCKNYHFCTGAGVSPIRGICPGTSIFDWAQRACLPSSGFVCALQSDPFECSGAGNFPNPNSNDGSTYFQCFVHWDGQILYQMGLCRAQEMFDAVQQRCVPRLPVLNGSQ